MPDEHDVSVLLGEDTRTDVLSGVPVHAHKLLKVYFWVVSPNDYFFFLLFANYLFLFLFVGEISLFGLILLVFPIL